MKQSPRHILICKKIAMSRVFTKDGNIIPVTILSANNNHVIDLKKYKYHFGVKLVFLGRKPVLLHDILQGKIKKQRSLIPTQTREFRLDNKPSLLPGSTLTIEQFKIGSYIDARGCSIGKGFAGAIKKHHFKGLKATHGVSTSHRSLGSTGQCQDPGKVFKGKKMAGHLGNSNNTQQNVEIIDVNTKLKLVVVKGSVPGKNNYIYISNSIKK